MGKFLLDVGNTEPKPAAQPQATDKLQMRRRDFERRARKAVALRPDGATKLLAGSVQLIGMNEIKTSLGAEWLAVAKAAHEIVERNIRRHLTESDSWERHADDAYILCFAGVDKADAERRTRRIVDETKAALQAEAPGTKELRIDHTVAELDWEDVTEKSETEGSLLAALASSLHQVQAEAHEAAKTWRRTLLRDTRILYGPMWRSSDRNVSLYRCMVDESTGRVAIDRLHCISSADEISEAVSDLDCLILSRTVEGLHRLIQSGASAEFLLPVNYITMHDRAHREAYLTLARDVPEPYRRFLNFELHSIPAGAPLSRLVELSQMIKPYGNAVAASATNLTPQRVAELGASGLFAASMDADTIPGSPSEILARLSRFVTVARTANLKSIVNGADTLGLARAAIEAKVDFAGGKAFGVAVETPRADRQVWSAA